MYILYIHKHAPSLSSSFSPSLPPSLLPSLPPSLSSSFLLPTRFHVLCAHFLCEEERSTFDPKMNNENLTKCLQTLKEFYRDLRLQKVRQGGRGRERERFILRPEIHTIAMLAMVCEKTQGKSTLWLVVLYTCSISHRCAYNAAAEDSPYYNCRPTYNIM